LDNILETINSPADLKKLSLPQLEKLAGEIRGLLIHTVSQTGGHLAPNLGVVELTIALHRVFDSPRDRIIWDVGHQAYVHKILTGRRGRFGTLRKLGGISGFPKREESAHDIFGTGHSSTSISAALGVALARDINREKHRVIAVIGDGSLTGGQAYEALNYAGNLETDITVILNDNEMSIARNVGAMAEYLAKLRTDPSYNRMKRDVEYLLRRIPAIGDSVAKTVERLKDGLKYLVVPGMLFEELGFTYIGPIDGHNLVSLTDVLQKSRHMKGPVLIHVITCKGKGYEPAEKNPDKFHGVGPFCVETGEIIKNGGNPSYTSVFGDALAAAAEGDDDIVAFTAAMAEGTGLRKFATRFPHRFFDVGIAEPNAVTMAAALAAEGKKPVVAVYSTFMQRAFDQVIHDVCLQKLPVVFAIDRAGIVGEDGPTHQGVFDLAYLRQIPNLTVMAPKDENELRHMLCTALNLGGPAAIRYPRGCGLGVDTSEPMHRLEVGQAEELRPGKDVVLLAAGVMAAPCLAASDLLARQGIRAGVVSARFVKPLDEQMLRRLARDVGVIVTVEDNVLAGGFGSAVLEYISNESLNWVKVFRVGLPDKFIEHGSRAELLTRYGLTGEGIAAVVAPFMQRFGVR
jgi:1-deoxy-D-xylulose-5-phosphate synthase